MDKGAVIEFFDKHAENWDAELIRNDTVIGRILTLSGISQNERVLDVACGTGVLIGDYLSLGVGSVLGVDISPKMAQLAAEKFEQDSRVQILCADVETAGLDSDFDRVMVYNAFPHFPDPEGLVRCLAGLLKPGGSLSIAHGQSRAEIDRRHQGSAHKVSLGLMEAEMLSEIFSKYLRVTVCISDDKMYMVSGVKES